MVTLKQGSPSPVLQLCDSVNLGCIASPTHLQLQESGSKGLKLGTLFQGAIKRYGLLRRK